MIKIQTLNFKIKVNMAVKNPQFGINLRKNDNQQNAGYGKYYPKALEKETISLEGLTKHMAEHNSIYGDDVIGGVLKKMSGCIIELLSQGNPVKIDKLGTFMPTVEATKNGITKAEILAGKWNASQYINGIHIRFIPEGSGDADITSRTFKSMCALNTYGVEEKIDLTPSETDKKKKKYIKKVTPLADWIAEQTGSSTSTHSGGNASGPSAEG